MKNSKQSTAMLLLMSLMFGSSNVVFAENQDQLAPITVSGTAETKAQEGKDQVYLKNQVTEYKSKKEIEAYRGNSAGDLLAGFSGVYSGDVRNGGAIDPIIRSSWGQGRVPVIVDGSEQAVTVWRGFAGASNRNYLDPFLISSVTVEKGNRLGRDLNAGPDGTVRMTTLEVDDVVKKGKKWGVEVKTETATNSTKKSQSPYSFNTDYRTLPNPGETMLGNYAILFKKGDRLQPRDGNRNKPFNDNAIRLATAYKGDKFEGLLAYAYRKKGNYYAGAHGDKKYGGNLTAADIQAMRENEEISDVKNNGDNVYVPYIGAIYKKKKEVPNTSYESKSFLAKTNFKFNDEMNLKFGYRHTQLNYGDIMPSRLYVTFDQLKTRSVVQWPEADVKQNIFNTEFHYDPKNNKYINLTLGAYIVHNKSNTNTSGGTPGDVLWGDPSYDKFIEKYPSNSLFKKYYEDIMNGVMKVDDPKFIAETKKLNEAYKNDKSYVPNTNGLFNTRNSQVQYSKDNHWGINVSNRLQLKPNLMLDIMANYRRETLDSSNITDIWDKYDLETGGDKATINGHQVYRGFGDFTSGSRKGKRKEFNTGFNFTYTPTDWLVLTAGAKYTHYKLKDLNIKQKIEDDGSKLQHDVARFFNVRKTLTKEDIEKYTKIIEQKEANGEPLTAIENKVKNLNKKIYTNPYSTPPQEPIIPPSLPPFMKVILQQNYQRQLAEYNTNKDSWKPAPEKIDISEFVIGRSPEEEEETRIYWYLGKDGKYHLEDNPLFDGRITDEMRTELQKHPFTGKVTPCAEGQRCPLQTDISYFLNNIEKKPYTSQEFAQLVNTKNGHAWSPSFGITAFITDYARIYARYNEINRMPSIFEGTTGFSVNGIDFRQNIKPEKTKSFEIGYVQDLTGIFPSLHRADFRINYFHNTTHNIFDRIYGGHQIGYTTHQFDKRTLSGLELQARYDEGRFFGDLSVTYNIKNKMCDKTAAFFSTPEVNINNYLNGTSAKLKAYPTCVNGGFGSGYLKNTILPKYSIVSNLGFRALHNKLEMSTRLTYHTNVKDTYAKSIRDAGLGNPHILTTRWQPVFLVDAYINYQFNQDFNISLAGTNLTDRYYLDPYSRSAMPGPGRTIKLGLTAKF